jgi:hypothetical protein
MQRDPSQRVKRSKLSHSDTRKDDEDVPLLTRRTSYSTPVIVAASTTDLYQLAVAMAVNNKVTEHHISMLTFEELNIFLRNEGVIHSTFAFVKKLIQECAVWNGCSPPSFQGTRNNPRIFMSLYFFSLHSKRALHIFNAESDALVLSAQNLSHQFTSITNVVLLKPCLTATLFKERRVKEISKEFYDAFDDFMSKFTLWKAEERRLMIVRTTDAIWNVFTAKMGLIGDQERANPQDQAMINEMDSAIERHRQHLMNTSCFMALGDIHERIAQELQNRRILFLLRQEHTRFGGVGAVFDFVEM